MSELIERLRNECSAGPECKCSLREAANLLEAQEARIKALLKENERLAGAWHNLHDRMVKDNKAHEDYFEKSQARMHELLTLSKAPSIK